jgi:hypothetical protein
MFGVLKIEFYYRFILPLRKSVERFFFESLCWLESSGILVTVDTDSDGVSPLFKFVSTDYIPSSEGNFIVKEKFACRFVSENEGNKYDNVVCIGDNFTMWYGDLVEGVLEPTVLRCYHLPQGWKGNSMIDGLGGENRSMTFLSWIYFLMKCRSRGEKGPLQINGQLNVFFVQDKIGFLRVVTVHLTDAGWYLNAFNPEDLNRNNLSMLYGARVFRNM